MSDKTTWDDLERADTPFWKSAPLTATSSAPLTLDALRAAADRLAAREQSPNILLTSVGVIEGAGRGIGWPELERHFEAIARGAAHAIFGNIALDVRAVVSPMTAGRFALGGEWPFPVAEWSAPQTIWD